MLFYEEKQRSVYTRLKSKGVSIILRDKPAAVTNKMTGAYTEGTPVDYGTYVLILEVVDKSQDDSSEATKNITTVMEADWDEKAGSALSVVVDNNVSVVIGGVEKEIIKNEPYMIGGIILWYDMTVAT